MKYDGMDGKWLSGLLSADGCFTFTPECHPIFSIRMKDNEDNEKLLTTIQYKFKIGKIYRNIQGYYNGKRKGIMLLVYGLDECIKLIPLINNTIYGDKEIQFRNWCTAIEHLNSVRKENIGEQFRIILTKEFKLFLRSIRPAANKENKILNFSGNVYNVKQKTAYDKEYIKRNMQKYLKKIGRR